MENATTVEKEDRGRLIVVIRKGNRKKITSITSLWESHSVEKSKKMKRRNITKNGW